MQSRTSVFKASHHVYILFPKLLRMNIHLFFNLYIFTFSFQQACLIRLTLTPDSRPRWAKRAETCPTPADCACVFVLKHPRETHDHAAISAARSSILCPASSVLCQTCSICMISDWMCWKPSEQIISLDALFPAELHLLLSEAHHAIPFTGWLSSTLKPSFCSHSPCWEVPSEHSSPINV